MRTHLSAWLAEQSPREPASIIQENVLLIRMTRLEEELKNQRDLMKQGFDLMEKRFEQVDRRFEQMDKRFEQSDQRFESLTKRIDRFMIWSFSLTVSMAGVIIAVLKLT